jgi:CRISPR-associated protein (TIGR02584 family)
MNRNAGKRSRPRAETVSPAGVGAGQRRTRSTVLFSVLGLSPAVITETVWALAHETPAVIPDRVVALTTRRGRDELRRQVFETGAWDRLRKTLKAEPLQLLFGDNADSVRLFSGPGQSADLDDVLTAADNEVVADFILGNLRQFTEDAEVRVIASLAGGRKTMGALTALCMSLLGRAGDRLVHVLAESPFDEHLEPPFLFPAPDVHVYRTRDGRAIRRRDAVITLCDVPFVPLRRLFERDLGHTAGGYMRLVESASGEVRDLTPDPRLRFDVLAGTCTADGTRVPLNELEFLTYFLIAGRRKRDEAAYTSAEDLRAATEQGLAGLLGAGDRRYRWLDAARRLLNGKGKEFRKIPSTIGQKLVRALGDLKARRCSPLTATRGRYELRLPRENIEGV